MKSQEMSEDAARAANARCDDEVRRVLRRWAETYETSHPSLRRDWQTLKEYVEEQALHDFFRHSEDPAGVLLKNRLIASHLSRREAWFDPVTHEPALGRYEQRIYNFLQRFGKESQHVPFRAIAAKKQTEESDNMDPRFYDPEQAKVNAGNYFATRASNANVYGQNSRALTRLGVKGPHDLHVLTHFGYLEDGLRQAKRMATEAGQAGETNTQFYVLYCRHSKAEGHFATALLALDPREPDQPKRMLACDTLLKQLPVHKRWWPHFVNSFTNVFGPEAEERLEDISHPLQKVNRSDEPTHNHDWNCSYYCAATARALIRIVQSNPALVLHRDLAAVQKRMIAPMRDYYHDKALDERPEIEATNLAKRWESGRQVIRDLIRQLSTKRRSEGFESP